MQHVPSTASFQDLAHAVATDLFGEELEVHKIGDTTLSYSFGILRRRRYLHFYAQITWDESGKRLMAECMPDSNKLPADRDWDRLLSRLNENLRPFLEEDKGPGSFVLCQGWWGVVPSFVGVINYRRMETDDELWDMLRGTLDRAVIAQRLAAPVFEAIKKKKNLSTHEVMSLLISECGSREVERKVLNPREIFFPRRLYGGSSQAFSAEH